MRSEAGTRARPRLARPGWSLPAVLVVTAVPAFVGLTAGSARAQQAESPGTTVRADYAWTLRTPGGEAVSLERYRGRPLFLNLWATWCAPCVAELASIERLAARPEAQGVVFLLVSPEAPEVVERFRRRLGLTLPVLVEGTRMPAAWRLRALPTTWIVSEGGRIVLRHRGAADWDRPDVARLLRALAEESEPEERRSGSEREEGGAIPPR